MALVKYWYRNAISLSLVGFLGFAGLFCSSVVSAEAVVSAEGAAQGAPALKAGLPVVGFFSFANALRIVRL